MTSIIIPIDLRARSNRSILNTLNVLSTLIVLKADKPLPPEPIKVISISSKDKQTTPPSSQFHLFSMYFFGPTASNLSDISAINMYVKI